MAGILRPPRCRRGDEIEKPERIAKDFVAQNDALTPAAIRLRGAGNPSASAYFRSVRFSTRRNGSTCGTSAYRKNASNRTYEGSSIVAKVAASTSDRLP